MEYWRLHLAMLTPDLMLINLAYLILVSGTLCRSVNGVRTLLILGAICFTAYGAVADVPSMIVWNSILGGLNLRSLALSMRDATPVQVAPEPASAKSTDSVERTPSRRR